MEQVQTPQNTAINPMDMASMIPENDRIGEPYTFLEGFSESVKTITFRKPKVSDLTISKKLSGDDKTLKIFSSISMISLPEIEENLGSRDFMKLKEKLEEHLFSRVVDVSDERNDIEKLSEIGKTIELFSPIEIEGEKVKSVTFQSVKAKTLVEIDKKHIYELDRSKQLVSSFTGISVNNLNLLYAYDFIFLKAVCEYYLKK